MRAFKTWFTSLVFGVAAIWVGAMLPAHAANILLVSGTVTKPDGSVAVGLDVTVENVDRGLTSDPVQTDENGAYSATFLEFFTDAVLAGDRIAVTVRENGLVRGFAEHTVAANEVDESTGTVTIDVALSGVTAQFSQASVAGDGAATATLTVEIVDQTGQPVTNDEPTATATLGTVGAFTNAGNGKYEATYTAPISTVDTEDTVIVSSSVLSGQQGQARIMVIGVPSSVSVSVADAALTADGASTTTVTVTITRNGIPVTDETVSLQATVGTVGAATNNGDGTYTATYTAGTTAGTVTIAATAEGSGDVGAAQLVLTPGPATDVTVAVAPETISSDGNATVTATFTDAYGNPVPGVAEVVASVTVGPGSIGAVSDNGDGTYSATYSVGVVTVLTTVTVQVAAGELSATATLDVTPEPPATTTILVVEGTVYREGGEVSAPDGLSVTVENLTTGKTSDGATGDAGAGRYTVTFADFIGGTSVASSGDTIRVTVTDENGDVRGQTEYYLRASDVESNAATVDVVTDIPVTSSIVAVTGVVAYEDGITPVSDAEGLVATVRVNGNANDTEVGNAGPGQFSLALFNAEKPFATGVQVSVTIRKGEEIVGEASVTASSKQIFEGTVDVGTITTTLIATAPAFAVSGSVVPATGADPAPPGSIVRVTNESRPDLGAQTSTIGDAGPDAYSVAFFDLGNDVIGSRETLLIEVIDPEGTMIGATEVAVTTADVLSGGVTADVTLTGVLIQVDLASTTVRYDTNGVAAVTIAAQAVAPDGTPTGTMIAFEPAKYFSPPVVDAQGRYASTFSANYSDENLLGPLTVTLTAAGKARRSITLDIVDDQGPEVTISPETLVVQAGRSLTLTANATDGTAITSYVWDVDKDGVVDGTGTTFTTSYDTDGDYVGNVTVTDVAGNATTVEFTVNVRSITVGGLAIDLPNYVRLLQQVLATSIDSPQIDPDTKALVKALLPQLIRDGSLIGVPVPIFPASLDAEPTRPVLVEDPSGLDLENFGNPLFIPLLQAASEDPTSLLNDTLRLPLANVGNKLDLYIQTLGASQVVAKLLGTSGAEYSVNADDISATGTFDYTFVVDEELLLFVLPAWPGSDTNPLKSVTLKLAEDKNGPYRDVPMELAVMSADGQPKRVWRATETLTAGRSFYYYYVVEFNSPIQIGGPLGTEVTRWAVPDVRNIQFEDRGFPGNPDPELQLPVLDAVALRIQPVLASLLSSIQAEATRLAEDAILNDPNLQAQIANDPEVQRIIQNRVLNDPQVQNAILANAQVQAVITAKLQSDAALQQSLLDDPAILDVLMQQPAVQDAQVAIATDVATQLADDPRVQKAAQDATQAALLSGASQADAIAAGQAAGEAKIRELAPPLVEARLQAALPGLLADVAPAILPVAGPKILPQVTDELGPIVAPIIIPFVQDEIQPILVAKFGPAFIGQALNNVVGDPSALVGQIQAALQDYGIKVGAAIALNAEVPIVSKFSVPDAAGLWIAHFDTESIPDGDYMVQIEVDGGALFANAKPIRLDRTPGRVGPLSIQANAGAGLYVRESDGVPVAAALDKSGSLTVSASIDGDGIGGIIQILGVEDDPDAQAQRIWVPVNQTAMLIAAALKEIADGTTENVYDTALLAVLLTDPDLVAKLQTLDPDGVTAFIAGFDALPAAEQNEVRRAAQAVSDIVLNGNAAAASSLLSLNFAMLQAYAGLVSNIGLSPAFIGSQGSVVMAFPPTGRYYLRGVAVDEFGNVSTQSVPERIDIVPAEPDVFRITQLSIGDQNANGSTTDPFETVAVGEDGSVNPDEFRLWANTTSVEVTYADVVRTAHPLTRVALESSLDGTTWSVVGELSAEELAAVAEGDTFTADFAVDPAQWFADGVTSVSLRVVATNALTVVGTSPVVAVQIDERPLAIEPEVLAFDYEQADDSVPSPDSGGLRGTLRFSAQTPNFTLPSIGSVRLEISTDGGASYIPLDETLGGPTDGVIATGEPAADQENAIVWSAEWDTTQAADTIEAGTDEARDATLDDNPYLVRAVLLADDGSVIEVNGQVIASDAITISTDNVDDVPPVSSTVITTVERESRTRGEFEPATQDADGAWILRAMARFTVEVSAEFKTIEGGQVELWAVNDAGEPDTLLGAEAVAEGQATYTFEVDTTLFSNGVYPLAGLVRDAAGNLELAVPDTTINVNVANILVGGLAPDDPAILALIRIVRTGALDVDRGLDEDVALRPVSGEVVFTLNSPEAERGDIFLSANPDDLSDEALADVDLNVTPDANGDFTFTADLSTVEDGLVYVRFVLGGSPNVPIPSAPIALQVDNTAPTVTILVPGAGNTVGTRPILWAQYADASGISVATLALSRPDGDVFSETVGDGSGVIGDTSPRSGLTFSSSQVLYETPESDALSAGAYVANVETTDLAGNVGGAQVGFVVERDTTAPTIASHAPVGTTTQLRPTISITFADDVAGVDKAGVAVAVTNASGTGVAGRVDLYDANGAPATVAAVMSGYVTFTPTVDLSAGEYTVDAVITDRDGNSTPVLWQFTVVTDEEPPLIVSTSPTGVVQTEDVTIAVAFTDESAVTATIALDGGTAENADIVDNSRARLAVTKLSQGSHEVVAVLTDAAGNKASAEWTFTVEIDIVPPVIATMTPTSFVGTLRPLISATYSDNKSGVDDGSVVLRLDGKKVTPTDVDVSRVTYRPKTDLKAGQHTVELTVADALGNEAAAEWEFTIETTPPTISTVVPAPGTKVRGNDEVRAAIVVTAFYADAQSGVDDGSVKLTVEQGGQAVGGSVAAKSDTAISWKPNGPLAAGVYTAKVSVADQVGNATEYQWSFIVEEEVALTRPPRIVPNPFADETALWIGLGREAEVSIRIYDINQRLVATSPTQVLLPGLQKIPLGDLLADFARGVYYCQIIIDSAEQQRVVRVLKMAKVR